MLFARTEAALRAEHGSAPWE
ncbi:TPA: hypothetical protein N0F65_011452 [Lagenidium giganteum]|uniref:Uncharacterized protein n=1 Tax=Lagenidium giganteum TaxID=4803 RepID=A0AAV2Z848_9STRA|nr:TPA: hypothetical protein N0F65_011452 [Lagenidium giganteum]